MNSTTSYKLPNLKIIIMSKRGPTKSTYRVSNNINVWKCKLMNHDRAVFAWGKWGVSGLQVAEENFQGGGLCSLS